MTRVRHECRTEVFADRRDAPWEATAPLHRLDEGEGISPADRASIHDHRCKINGLPDALPYRSGSWARLGTPL
jgi:hypothetical protein